MMYEWKAAHIRYMRDASDYGDYHRRLAEKLLPHLPQGGHICDAGCGLGDLTLALSPYFRQITACDVSADALQELRRRVKQERIRLLCGDVRENPPQTPYDGMVFCLFGSPETVLQVASAQCRGTVCVICREQRARHFSVDEQAMHSDDPDRWVRLLDRAGVPFYQERFSLSFGQPFRSREDAIHFFALYNQEEKMPEWECVAARIEATGREDFPFYAPQEKALRLLCFDSRDLK